MKIINAYFAAANQIRKKKQEMEIVKGTVGETSHSLRDNLQQSNIFAYL